MDILTLTMAKAYTNSQRLAYSEGERIEILPEVTAQRHSVLPGVSVSKFEENKEYTVIYDGMPYKVKAQLHPTFGDSYLGNLGLLVAQNFTDNGLPFLFIFDVTTLIFICHYSDDNLHTLSIYQGEETIHPIDPKFIPAMDSLTLNGADGNQYKVAVDENGALTATAIE